MKKILIIDNYDSFVYNIAQLFGKLSTTPVVFRNNKITIDEINKMQPDGIVLSPGPGHPADEKSFGICGDIIETIGPRIPVLGVCLGHQAIGQYFGGRVSRAPEPVHGKPVEVSHDGRSIFEGLPEKFKAGRYHSLIVEREGMPDCLEISAESPDGLVMGLRHKELPIEGVQFHPESILTEHGKQMLENFLAL